MEQSKKWYAVRTVLEHLNENNWRILDRSGDNILSSTDVGEEIEAKKIMEVLADQHLFLYDNNMIPDYSNTIIIVMWCDLDGDGDMGWGDYWNDAEQMDWHEYVETYLNEQ
jgi:hypothetical protein